MSLFLFNEFLYSQSSALFMSLHEEYNGLSQHSPKQSSLTHSAYIPVHFTIRTIMPCTFTLFPSPLSVDLCNPGIVAYPHHSASCKCVQAGLERGIFPPWSPDILGAPTESSLTVQWVWLKQLFYWGRLPDPCG